jgi:hypothetical protein
MTITASMGDQKDHPEKEDPQQSHCYSIWLLPPEPHLSQLQKGINALSEHYKTSSFLPHVTVSGRLECRNQDEAVQKWETLRERLSNPTHNMMIRVIPCRFGTHLKNVEWDEHRMTVYPPGSIVQVPSQWNQASVIVMERSHE